MATFLPGHLHIERHPVNDGDASYDLNIDYEVTTDPKEGKGMLFTMHGSIGEKEVKETFFLPKDQAFNFASNVTRIAEKHGIPKSQSSIGSTHKHYDAMFEDIRLQLDVKPGDPIKPEHLQ